MVNRKRELLLALICHIAFVGSFFEGKRVIAAEMDNDQYTSFPASMTLNSAIDLAQAVNLALQRNPDLRIANERIGIAEAQVGESLASFYPQVKGRGSYTYSDNPAQVFSMIVSQRDFTQQDISNINNPGGRTNFRPEITGSMSLYRGGQDYQRYKIVELGVEISNLQHSTIRNNLIRMVTDNYYALLVAKENQIIANRSMDAVSRELKITETRYQEGTALKSDVLSLQVRLASAREEEIRADNAIEMAKTGLRTLLDLNPSSPLETANQNHEEIPELTASFTELLALAVVNRPEIKITDMQVASIRRKIKIVQGEHLPRINAFVNYGLDSENGSISSELDNVTTGIVMEMDLFSGFGTQKRVQQAQRKLAEAQHNAHKVRLQINREVKNAYLAFKDALQRFKVAETSVKAAAEAYRLVTVQYQAGTATVTRYIESEVARDQADARTIVARYDTFRADAALKQALGEWK